MKYGSVCSGIEAATVAWEKIEGWEPQWFCEIEKFPSAVLKHHWPHIPNLKDMTKLLDNETFKASTIDLLVGGTPCQAFSIAGLRAGLDDERGNLSLEYIKLLGAKRPRWFVWENVPGVLNSNDGADFAAILSGWTGRDVAAQQFDTTGIIQGEFYSVCWRILDSQYFGVPQRRRRVFVVGYLGTDWRPPFAVLFERDSLRRDFTPSRKKRKETPRTVGESTPATIRMRGGIEGGGKGALVSDNLSLTLATANDQTLITGVEVPYGIDEECNASENHFGPLLRGGQGGTRQAVVYPIHDKATRTKDNTGGNGLGIGKDGDPAPTLTAGDKHGVYFDYQALGQYGENEVSSTLSARDCKSARDLVCFSFDSLTSNSMKSNNPDSGCHESETIKTLDTTRPDPSKNQGGNLILHNGTPFYSLARRLTPTECARLQGFPDDHANIPWNGKETAPDGLQYKAYGNSMTTNVMLWIGQRIDKVDKIIKSLPFSA